MCIKAKLPAQHSQNHQSEIDLRFNQYRYFRNGTFQTQNKCQYRSWVDAILEGLIVHKQRYRTGDSNKNVDI